MTATKQHQIAVVLTWHGKVGLFKRGRGLTQDGGKWHCLTGASDASVSPVEDAARELFEQTGLRVADLASLEEGAVLRLPGDEVVRTFHARTSHRRVRIPADHESIRWVTPSRIRRFDGRAVLFDRVVDALDLRPQRSRSAQAGLQEGPG